MDAARQIDHWFRKRFGAPTPVQRLAWPAVERGEHVLVSAATGTGKTLAAFLPILAQLLTAPTGRCLYIAPLRALISDVRRNLRRHLREIRAQAGIELPRLRVAARTGDTPARLRARLLDEPPDLLLTTPETLALLLSQPLASGLLQGVRWIVLDEVHALAVNKRGADLALSLERVTALCATEPQRIGLSATSAPLSEAARFLAGAARPCTIVHVPEAGPLDVRVEPLLADDRASFPLTFLNALVDRLGPELCAHRSTLIFTNARGLAERLSWALRRRFPAWDREIAAHHSSLDAARRRVVEHRFKQGRLRAVCASTSLELGIDIGAVDNVVLVHPPGGVVRLLQRLGRGGHEPGRPRRGLVLAANSAELLEATVTLASGRSAQLEPLQPCLAPLDVLCQQIVGMAVEREWSIQEAFALVRRATPFADLTSADFQACLDYLSGRDRDGRAWLPARIDVHGDRFVIHDQRTAKILRANIGTILSEDMRTVRLVEQGQGDERSLTLGEVDSIYAERLQPGDRFLLDGRCLECRQTEAVDVLVQEVPGRPAVPRWHSDGWTMSPELARRLHVFRQQAAESLRDGPDALAHLLERDYALDDDAVAELVRYFQRQECVSEIPDVATCLIECVPNEMGIDYYLHTPLNRSANDALARVLVWRLARTRGWSLTSLVADLGLGMLCRSQAPLSPSDWTALLASEAFEADLDQALAESPALRERFQRVATTGLMVLRNPLGRKRRVGGPDWAERRLFDQVRARQPDFVLLRQAERELRADLGAVDARAYLDELPRLAIRCRWLSAVSPFVEAWTQLEAGPVESSVAPADALRRLHAELTVRSA